MPVVEEAPRKLTLQDRAEEFGQKTYEQAEAKKVLVRNLKLKMHKVIRISRKNLMESVVYSSVPIGMIQPGAVSRRHIGDSDWHFGEFGYNVFDGNAFPSLVGIVIGYEVVERESGGTAYFIVAVPNDRFEYKFDVRHSEIEMLDGFPSTEGE